MQQGHLSVGSAWAVDSYCLYFQPAALHPQCISKYIRNAWTARRFCMGSSTRPTSSHTSTALPLWGGGGMGTYKMLWKDLTSPHPPHSKCQAPMLFLWELEHLGQPKGKPMAAVPPWAELQRRQHALQSSDGPVVSSLGLGCSPTTLNISCPSALNQGLLLIKVAEFLL